MGASCVVPIENEPILNIENGINYYKSGKYQSSIEVQNKLLENNPHNYEIFFQKSLSLYQLKNYVESLEDLEQSIEQSNHNIKYLYFKSIVLQQQGKCELAIYKYNQIHHSKIYQDHAIIDWLQIEFDLQELKSVEEELVELIYKKAKEEILNSNTFEAIEFLITIAYLDKKDLSKLELLQNVQYDKQMYHESIKVLEELTILNNKNQSYQYKIGICKIKIGDINVEQQFNKAISLIEIKKNQNPELQITQANFLMKKGVGNQSIDTVSDLYDNAISLDERQWNDQAYFLKINKLYQKAIDAYNNYINFCVDFDPSIVYHKIYCQENMNLLEETIDCYNELIDYDPNNQELQIEKAKILDKLDKINDSIDNQNKARMLNIKLDLELFNQIIWMYTRREQQENGLKQFDNQENQQDINFLMEKAVWVKDYNSISLAIEIYDKLIEINPENQTYYQFIFDCLQQAQEINLLKIYYQKFKVLQPNNTEIDRYTYLVKL